MGENRKARYGFVGKWCAHHGLLFYIYNVGISFFSGRLGLTVRLGSSIPGGAGSSLEKGDKGAYILHFP